MMRMASSELRRAAFRATVVDLARSSALPSPSHKLVTLVRHGEATHNAAFFAGALGVLRRVPTRVHSAHIAPPAGGRDPASNLDPAHRDSRLTATGEAQCHGLRDHLRTVSAGRPLFDAACVSSLSRALSTCMIAVAPHLAPAAPLLALDELRERSGLHPCDNRRDRAALEAEFGPAVDFR
jgi:broad specificity phosphatase PhoE